MLVAEAVKDLAQELRAELRGLRDRLDRLEQRECGGAQAQVQAQVQVQVEG